ncbi:ABC transporter ATP-binding protein [Kribbella solani]|uniref:ABC transporter ATP-binding protein n=1 Tax=Kribbella solani TaxID=236067 RepID=UPI0029B44EFD|nr:ATP-binding cassette domain-containing protein [Kribbella solani]MDX2972175.1 ATP-binding cassette domain-containing protein [Kribbella solani]
MAEVSTSETPQLLRAAKSTVSAQPLIEVCELTKEFSRPDVRPGRFIGTRSLFTRARKITRAVDRVSFQIDAGELVGFLGPNGAGKSTTIKMLTGILVPTSGIVTVAGRTPWRDRRGNARTIGAVFGQRSQLWYDLPLRNSFEIIRDLYAMRPEIYRRRLGEFSELLDLDDFIDTPVRSLSLGQRMRGDLVAAMLYAPPILYLDEPTVGLDVVAKGKIREFVAEINADQGTTIVLTTHDMDDVERLCRRVVIIDHGRLLYEGELETLKAQYVTHREVVVHCTDVDATTITSPHAEVISADTVKARLRFALTATAAPKVIHDLTSRYPITDLSVLEPDLEDVIRHLYTERSRST